MAMSTLTKVISNFVCRRETTSKIYKTSAVKYLGIFVVDSLFNQQSKKTVCDRKCSKN